MTVPALAVLLLPLAAAVLGLVGARPPGVPRPLVAAHRGGSLLWPENSLLAFRNALGLGVDLVETDVHLTADGEVVVMHDATLDRTSTGHGALRDATLAELRALRLRAADGTATAERIPTLAELLDLLRPTGAGLLLEIKVAADGQPYAGIEAKALDQLRAAGLLDRTVLMAFEPDTVKRVRALAPTAHAALLVGGAASALALDAIRAARALGATHLGLDYRLVDRGVVDRAHAAGLRVGAWTVNVEGDMRRMVDAGVDVLISDRPDVAVRVVGR